MQQAATPEAKVVVAEAAAAAAASMADDAGKPDVMRDTWVRYLGYANEVGEAFRPVAPALVRPSYGVAFGYVLADTAHKTWQFKGDAAAQGRAAIDTLVWQTLASVVLPGLAINRVVRVTELATVAAGVTHAPVRRWAPVLTGLAVIPAIIKPIDDSVHWALDNTLRRHLS